VRRRTYAVGVVRARDGAGRVACEGPAQRVEVDVLRPLGGSRDCIIALVTPSKAAADQWHRGWPLRLHWI
jgi:hypothetical protein